MCGLDTAASVAKVEDSCCCRDISSGNPVGNPMGEVGTVHPLHFSIAVFTETVPPDETWAGGGDRVVGGRGIDSSVVGWLEQVGLFSVFPCRV